METRKHVLEESFEAAPERVFRLLVTPSDIRGWWSASRAIVLPERGGSFAATWGAEDDPDYVTIATIRAFEPPARLVLADYRYRAKTGPLPFEADFVTEFLVIPEDRGARLRVTQDGFPCDARADAFYAGCERGWKDTFDGIRRHLEREGSALPPARG